MTEEADNTLLLLSESAPMAEAHTSCDQKKNNSNFMSNVCLICQQQAYTVV